MPRRRIAHQILPRKDSIIGGIHSEYDHNDTAIIEIDPNHYDELDASKKLVQQDEIDVSPPHVGDELVFRRYRRAERRPFLVGNGPADPGDFAGHGGMGVCLSVAGSLGPADDPY